jgi:carbonic anhydrase
MLERNKEHQATRTPPPDLLTMSKFAQASGQGVFVISCSDPRLNPYRILGLDPAREAST